MDEITKLKNMVAIRRKKVTNDVICIYIDYVLKYKPEKATIKENEIIALIDEQTEDIDTLNKQKEKLDKIMEYMSTIKESEGDYFLQKTITNVIAGILIIGFIFIVFKVVTWSSSPSRRHTPSRDHIEIVAQVEVSSYLKNVYLRDPDSYQSISWSKIVTKNDGNYIRHVFRAKNGFGGYVTEDRIFHVDKSGVLSSKASQ